MNLGNMGMCQERQGMGKSCELWKHGDVLRSVGDMEKSRE